MSNFAVFSEFYDTLSAYSEYIPRTEFLKHRAFLELCGSIKALRDTFAESEIPSYSLLTDALSKSQVPFHVSEIDEYLKTKVKPALLVLKNEQINSISFQLQKNLVEIYSERISPEEKEAKMIACAKTAGLNGASRSFIYITLVQLKRKYFGPEGFFSHAVASFQKIINVFAPARFDAGDYSHVILPVTAYYRYYQQLVSEKAPPYSARDARTEIEAQIEREAALSELPMSTSAPELRYKNGLN